MLQATRPSTFILEGNSGGGTGESDKHEENCYVTQGGWEIKEMLKKAEILGMLLRERNV